MLHSTTPDKDSRPDPAAVGTLSALSCESKPALGKVRKNRRKDCRERSLQRSPLPWGTEFKWFRHSTRNGTASVPYQGPNIFTVSEEQRVRATVHFVSPPMLNPKVMSRPGIVGDAAGKMRAFPHWRLQLLRVFQRGFPAKLPESREAACHLRHL